MMKEQQSPETSLRSPRWSPWLGLMVVALVGMYFFKLGSYQTIGSHEAYATVPAQEMMKGGDWIVPRYAGVPRLTKPPLMYWILAGAGKLTGNFNEWIARTPTVICAFLLAWLMKIWAARWYGYWAGWSAFGIQCTCMWMLFYGRRAEMDIPLCLVTTLAMFLIIEDIPNRTWKSGQNRWLGIYLLLTIAWMFKFYYGPAMVLLPVCLFYLGQKRYHDLRHLLNPLGFSILFFVAVWWPYMVLKQVPDAWEIWYIETAGRHIGELESEPPWYYLPHLLMLLLPWTHLSFAMWPQSWREAFRLKNPREQFLWAWVIGDLMLLLASENKHPNYLLAMLPAFTLWGARMAPIWGNQIAAGTTRLQRIPLFWLWCGCVALVIFPALVLQKKYPILTVSIWCLCSLIGGGLAVFFWWHHRRAVKPMMITIGIVFTVLFLALNQWVLPQHDHRFHAARFADSVSTEFAPDAPVGLYKAGQATYAYYLKSPVQRYDTSEDLTAALESQRPVLLLAYEQDLPELQTLAVVRPLEAMPVLPDYSAPRHPPLVLVEVQPKGKPTPEAEPPLRISSHQNPSLK